MQGILPGYAGRQRTAEAVENVTAWSGKSEEEKE